MLRQEHNKRRIEIKNKLREFSKPKTNDELFYELCFCILTPQSKAKLCWGSVLKLREEDFLNRNINLSNYLTGVRFPKNKTKYLLEAKEKFLGIIQKLRTTNQVQSNKEFREWLVKNVKGIGYKEASHFLRNIGFRNMAILDRHILKNLLKHKVIREIPKTLTKKKYLEIENKMLNFSEKINIPIDELDLLFWSFETGEVFK